MNIAHILYDSRLTNSQRVFISRTIQDNARITGAKIHESKKGAQLFLWREGLVPVRVDPQGREWAVAR